MILVLDWSNLIHRAARAGKVLLRDPYTGQITNTFHYTLSMLETYLRMFQPSKIIIAFDDFRGQYLRKRAYPAYKARRKENRSAADKQELSRIYSDMRELEQLLQHLPVYAAWCEGLEADDIVSWTCRVAFPGALTTVVSTDKDMLQLVSGTTHVFYPGKTERLINIDTWETHLSAMLKLDPTQVPSIDNYVSYKAIVGETGETSDNIPGINGFGPAKTAKLLKDYGSYENAVRTIRNHGDRKLTTLEERLISPEALDVYTRNWKLMNLSVYLDQMSGIQIRQCSWNPQEFYAACNKWSLAKIMSGSLPQEFSRIAQENAVISR